MVGQTLATRPEQGYRALLEATAYGTRVIVEAFVDAGIPVTSLIVMFLATLVVYGLVVYGERETV